MKVQFWLLQKAARYFFFYLSLSELVMGGILCTGKNGNSLFNSFQFEKIKIKKIYSCQYGT